MLRLRLLAVVLLTGLGLAACTSGSSPSAPTSAPPSRAATAVGSTPPAATGTPAAVSSGPTTASAAASCPLVSQAFVHETLGVRLGRLTVLRSGGHVVGCRFYAQQRPDSQCGATCLAGEHLPGPNQPAVEVTTQHYASSIDAHNAFVLRAGTSGAIIQTDVNGTTGLCFPTDFDPSDKGTDYACTVNRATVVVLVRTVDTAHTVGTSLILKSVLRGVSQ